MPLCAVGRSLALISYCFYIQTVNREVANSVPSQSKSCMQNTQSSAALYTCSAGTNTFMQTIQCWSTWRTCNTNYPCIQLLVKHMAIWVVTFQSPSIGLLSIERGYNHTRCCPGTDKDQGTKEDSESVQRYSLTNPQWQLTTKNSDYNGVTFPIYSTH